MTDWIPCKERLPAPENSADDYLVTYRRKFQRTLVRGEVIEHMEVGVGYHAGVYWIIYGEGALELDEVIAWMPLPEPYSEE